MTPDDLIRAARRIYMTIRRGRVGLVDDTGTVQRMQADFGPIGPDGASLGIHDQIPVVCQYGFYSNPPVGADVIGLAVGGDFGNLVVIGHNHQPSRPTGGAPGEINIQWMATSLSIKLTAAGLVLGDQWGNTVTMAEAAMTLQHSAKVIIEAPAVELGAAGGPAIARVGDTVNLVTGVIATGSDKVTAA